MKPKTEQIETLAITLACADALFEPIRELNQSVRTARMELRQRYLDRGAKYRATDRSTTGRQHTMKHLAAIHKAGWIDLWTGSGRGSELRLTELGAELARRAAWQSTRVTSRGWLMNLAKLQKKCPAKWKYVDGKRRVWVSEHAMIDPSQDFPVSEMLQYAAPWLLGGEVESMSVSARMAPLPAYFRVTPIGQSYLRQIDRKTVEHDLCEALALQCFETETAGIPVAEQQRLSELFIEHFARERAALATAKPTNERSILGLPYPPL